MQHGCIDSEQSFQSQLKLNKEAVKTTMQVCTS